MVYVQNRHSTKANMSWQITRRINVFTPTKSMWALGLIYESDFLWIGLGLLVIEVEI